MKDYYAEIDKAIQSYENHKPWHDKTTLWICDRITWAWKWKKINKNQMEELAERITKILEEM